MAINFLNSVDFNKNELLNPTIENQPNDAGAGTGVEGQLYFNTTDDILKVYAGGSWVEVGGGVTSLTTTDGTYIDLTPNSATTGAVTVTADLSAVDGTAAAGERYLTKNNTWATVASIPGTYTFDVEGDTGNQQTVGSGSTLEIFGGTYIDTNSYSGPGVTINHNDTSRTDTTSTDAPGYNGTFEAVTSVTTNATGHVTAIDVSTVTLPASIDNYVDSISFNTGSGVLTLGRTGTLTDLTQDLDGRYLTGNETITLTGDVTGSGTTSIATTISTGAVDFAMLNPTAIITEAEGIENNDNDTTIPTSAAVKDYVDDNIVGGLVYQGGYNASTNTPNLDSNPSPNPIKTGWTYTVTVDGLFFTEQVRVGDVLIAENDAPTTLAEWTTVQNNIDLADLTTVGLGNVNAGDAIDVSYSSGTATVSAEDSTASNKGVIIVSKETSAEYRGAYVNYDASGEVSIGLDIDTIPEDATPPMDESVMVYHDEQTGENFSIQISDLLALASGQTSYATTITDTATITHGLGTKDVIIQLYDVTTDETVYADVDRISTTQATITFASTPTNSIRVLVQKIG